MALIQPRLQPHAAVEQPLAPLRSLGNAKPARTKLARALPNVVERHAIEQCRVRGSQESRDQVGVVHVEAPDVVARVPQSRRLDVVREQEQPGVLDGAGRQHEGSRPDHAGSARLAARPYPLNGRAEIVGLDADGRGVVQHGRARCGRDAVPQQACDPFSRDQPVDRGDGDTLRERQRLGAAPVRARQFARR